MPRPTEVKPRNLPPPTSHHYHYLTMPTARVCTYNICGYSARTTGKSPKTGLSYADRRAKLLANMKAAMRDVDIMLVQETKIQTAEVRAHFKRDWYLFRNPYFEWSYDRKTEAWEKRGRAVAGQDMYVRITFAHNFTLTHTVVEKGYLHYVTFTPRSKILTSRPYFTKSFLVLNAYIPTDSDRSKIDMLTRLRKHPLQADYIFAAGDWNVTSHAGDSTTAKRSPSSVIKSLDKAAEAHGLEEVYHPCKTKVSKQEIPHASRLDKHFTSHSHAEREIMVPNVWLPPHPHEPGHDFASPSDHFPVAISFIPHDHTGKGKFTIPVHVVRQPAFAETVATMWAERENKEDSRSRDPNEDLYQLELMMTNSARKLMAERKHETEGRLEALTLAIAVYRSLVDGSAHYVTACRRCNLNVELAKIVVNTGTTEGLKTVLEDYIYKAAHRVHDEDTDYSKTRSTYEKRAHSYAPRTAFTGRDHHTNIRACVSTSSHLNFIVNDSDERVEDPEGMAAALKQAWEPIWKGSPAGARATRRYLRGYTKKIEGTVPDVTIDMVIEEVTRSRSSSPGPNGIPFLAYAVLCDIAAPVLLAAIKHLMQGATPKRKFNWCRAFFLPKDSTHRPRATRPIAASNTSNRMIANIVRRVLEPHILPLLCQHQTGFVRGRRIDEHIRYFNSKYYSALYTRYSSLYPGPGMDYPYKKNKKSKELTSFTQEDNPDPLPAEAREDYHILFLDFAKAFDSVSRTYLMAILERIGVPESYRNIIWALFHDVMAEPSVGGKTRVLIRMHDGLKQGCPLSTLFFIIALDPLITQMAKLPRLDARAFADDIAMGTSSLTNLTPVFPLIESWSAVSRCKANFSKTKLLSTDPDRPPLLTVLPPTWREVKFTDSYVYLGILMGNSIDVSNVMEAALAKFQARIGSYLPAKSRFTLSNRVKIANTYLLPVFSYLFRFFLATKFISDRIEEGLRRWLVKGSATNLDRLRAPTHQVGLHCPLVNHLHLNIASLLREGDRPPPLTESHVGSYSLTMRDHRIRAAERYENQVGTPYDAAACQADHMHALSHSNPAPICRLLETCDRRVRRHRIDGRSDSDVDVTTATRNLMRNSLALPKSLARPLRDHLFDVTHNLLFTGHRTRRYIEDVGKQKCRLCGYGVESVAHLFVTCPVAVEARELLSMQHEPAAVKLSDRLSGASVDDHKLLQPMSPARSIALLSFSLAIWRVRWSYTEGGPPPLVSTAAGQVVARCLSNNKYARGFQRRDRTLEKLTFESLLATLPPGVSIYTDGSSYGNPGPAGSGFCAYDSAGRVAQHASHYLGSATNNYAEVDGIKEALAYVLNSTLHDSKEPVFVFTDNRQAINIAVGRSSPAWCTDEARDIRTMVTSLTESRRVHFYWVPGHAGIPGNDLADKLAKLGAAGHDTTGIEPPDFSPPQPDEDKRPRTKPGDCTLCTDTTSNALGKRKPPRPTEPIRRRIVEHRYATRSATSRMVQPAPPTEMYQREANRGGAWTTQQLTSTQDANSNTRDATETRTTIHTTTTHYNNSKTNIPRTHTHIHTDSNYNQHRPSGAISPHTHLPTKNSRMIERRAHPGETSLAARNSQGSVVVEVRQTQLLDEPGTAVPSKRGKACPPLHLRGASEEAKTLRSSAEVSPLPRAVVAAPTPSSRRLDTMPSRSSPGALTQGKLHVTNLIHTTSTRKNPTKVQKGPEVPGSNFPT